MDSNISIRSDQISCYKLSDAGYIRWFLKKAKSSSVLMDSFMKLLPQLGWEIRQLLISQYTDKNKTEHHRIYQIDMEPWDLLQSEMAPKAEGPWIGMMVGEFGLVEERRGEEVSIF